MHMRNWIIIVAQAGLLYTSTPAMAEDTSIIIMRGLTEGIEQYRKALEEESRERRMMERLQALQRKQFEQARQLQIEQWEREKAERQERLEALRRQQEELQRQAAAQKQQALEQQKSMQLAEEERQRRMGVTGSGFLVAPGYVATNAHVIQDFPYVTVRTRSGQTYAATVVAKDSAHDLALLHVAIKSGGLAIRPAATIRKGESVYAIGYPVLQLQGSESKITEGVISSFSGMQDNDQLFQISVPIQHGNSGGPLLNKQGEVVGIVVAMANAATWLKLGADLPQNVNYAIKPDLLLTMMKQNGIKPVSATAKQKQPLDYADQNTLLVAAKGEADLQAQPIPQPADARASKVVETKPDTSAPGIAKADSAKKAPAPPREKPAIASTTAGKEAMPAPQASNSKHPEATASVPDNRMLDMPAGQSYQYALAAISSKDYPTAVKLLNTALEQGYVPAATALGMLYDRGEGVTADQIQALRWFRYAADKGHGLAQAQLGRYYSMGRGGLANSDKDAVFWFQKAADSGDATGQTNLGLMYKTGWGGLVRDEAQARVLFEKAASQKNPRAMFELGKFYEQGRGGVEKDDAQAAQQFRLGAEAGNPNAQIALGSYYEHGQGGLPLDAELGRKWLEKAANQEDATALYELGMHYLKGDSAYEQSKPVAVSYLVRARKQGHPQATSILRKLID